MGIVWGGLNSFHGLRDFFRETEPFNAENAECAEIVWISSSGRSRRAALVPRVAAKEIPDFRFGTSDPCMANVNFALEDYGRGTAAPGGHLLVEAGRGLFIGAERSGCAAPGTGIRGSPEVDAVVAGGQIVVELPPEPAGPAAIGDDRIGVAVQFVHGNG